MHNLLLLDGFIWIIKAVPILKESEENQINLKLFYEPIDFIKFDLLFCNWKTKHKFMNYTQVQNYLSTNL